MALLAAVLSCVALAARPVSGRAGDDLLLLTTAARNVATAPAVSAAIGPDGGALRTGRATLTIPAGALTETVTVTLAGARPPADFGPQPLGGSFALEVGTEIVCQPLTLSVSGYGAPDRTEPFALGDSLIDAEGHVLAAAPGAVPGLVRGGVLTATLPATGDCVRFGRSGGKTAGEQGKVKAVGFSMVGYRFRESEHFTVAYPIGLAGLSRDIVADILAYAEEARTLLLSMGFDFEAKLAGKVCVTVTRLDEQGGQTGVPLWGGKEASYFTIAEKICDPNDLQRLKVTVAHEFFHVVQNAAYDPRTSLQIRHSWASGVFQWLGDASSVWFESRVLDSATYVSQNFTDHLYMRTKGLECYTSRENAQDTGYWASGFLRYLADYGHVDLEEGDPFILGVWQNVSRQDGSSLPYSDLRAVIDTVGASIDASLRWTRYAEAVSGGATRYANWPAPARYKYQAVEGSLGKTFTDAVPPFSVQGWLYYIRDVAPDRTTFSLTVTERDEKTSYRLFRKLYGEEAYTDIQALRYAEPYVFTSSGNDYYYVVVSNADTTAPYTALSRAQVVLSSGTECEYCGDIPSDYRYYVSSENRVRKWIHPTIDEHLYAELRYLDDGTMSTVIAASCFHPAMGLLKSQTYWSDGQYMSQYIPYNEAGRKHGTMTTWHANGQTACINDFVDGSLNGRHRCSYETGGPLSTGTWAADQKDGEWLYYGPAGELTRRCLYAGGLEVGCEDY